MKDIVMVECKKHSATIPERTCFLRFGEIKYHSGKRIHDFDGCKDCKIGAEIYERLLSKKEPATVKRKNPDKICTVCNKSMGISMFGNKGKNDVCIECEGNVIVSKEVEPKDNKKENNLTKVCSKSDCKQEKPLGDFYKNISNPDGLSDWCKSCQKKATRDYQKKKKPESQFAKPKEKTETKKEEKTSDYVIMIDFSLHKDLLERLKKKAKKEFRTVEQQVLFSCSALTK